MNDPVAGISLPRVFRQTALLAALAVSIPQALADHIENPTATFSGLGKITGRIIHFNASINETVQFGSLLITPRICDSRPATQAPQTESFIQVERVDAANKFKRIFSGWVFASSPGLNGIEDPIYDIWLNKCSGGTTVIASQKTDPEDSLAQSEATTDTLKLSPSPLDTLLAQKPTSNVRHAPKNLPLRTAPRQRFFPTDNRPGAASGPQGVY